MRVGSVWGKFGMFEGPRDEEVGEICVGEGGKSGIGILLPRRDRERRRVKRRNNEKEKRKTSEEEIDEEARHF